jgi:hypothetical protein
MRRTIFYIPINLPEKKYLFKIFLKLINLILVILVRIVIILRQGNTERVDEVEHTKTDDLKRN